MWRKPKGNDMADFTDISRIGEDCYDGLSVPAVTTIQNGRTLIAGWLKMQNWGGALVIHEMVECSDGVPGTKFVEELIPTQSFVTLVAIQLLAIMSKSTQLATATVIHALY